MFLLNQFSPYKNVLLSLLPKLISKIFSSRKYNVRPFWPLEKDLCFCIRPRTCLSYWEVNNSWFGAKCDHKVPKCGWVRSVPLRFLFLNDTEARNYCREKVFCVGLTDWLFNAIRRCASSKNALVTCCNNLWQIVVDFHRIDQHLSSFSPQFLFS